MIKETKEVIREMGAAERYEKLAGSEPFLVPDKPFLLMYQDEMDKSYYEWYDDEEEFQERVKILKSYCYLNIDAIEIGSYREIDVEKI